MPSVPEEEGTDEKGSAVSPGSRTGHHQPHPMGHSTLANAEGRRNYEAAHRLQKQNQVTVADLYPMSRKDDLVDEVSSVTHVTKIDLLKSILPGTFVCEGEGSFCVRHSRRPIRVHRHAVWNEEQRQHLPVLCKPHCGQSLQRQDVRT